MKELPDTKYLSREAKKLTNLIDKQLTDTNRELVKLKKQIQIKKNVLKNISKTVSTEREKLEAFKQRIRHGKKLLSQEDKDTSRQYKRMLGKVDLLKAEALRTADTIESNNRVIDALECDINYKGFPVNFIGQTIALNFNSIDYTNIHSSSEIIQNATPMPTKKKYSGIYFLIKEGVIVYVGQSVDVLNRIFGSHVRDKDFDQIAFIECEKNIFDALETFYIKMFDPALNVMKGVRKLKEMTAIELIEILQNNGIRTQEVAA